MSYIPKLLFPRSSSGCPTPYIKIPIFPTVLGEATFIQYWIPSCLWLSVHAWTFFSFWAFQPVCQGTAASLFHTLILHDGRKNINHLRDAEDTTLMAESEEELKSLLIRVKEWKSWLKTQHSEKDHGIRSHHFMGNRWGNSGNSVRLYFWGAPKSLQMVIASMKLKDAYSLEGKLWPT